MAVEGTNVHVVWEDYRLGAENREIYYITSSDLGRTWGDETRLTYAPEWSKVPKLTVSSRNGRSAKYLYLVWEDYREEYGPQIFFKRKDLQIRVAEERYFPLRVKVYPNPTQGSIYADFGTTVAKVTLYDPLGRKEKEVRWVNRLKLVLPAGIHFLYAEKGEQVVLQKIVVLK
ncbi:hypothetical protein DRP53_10900 [candidate division WOR-3 bacterium]|uniref:T9SS type A sorting domain-containing protein n=1 Tax=candidate division WOR-3 bacterium TaxID=2052148 RepID=A0A660SEC8_UNCW3|nr:MAG: hypothetical protein DRP53_10900 [candidate division WOR-3 bacterium]